MPERLPNTGEDNWQDIMGANDGAGGFLRVSHNDDGTLKFPGSSYLIADTAEVAGNASGAYVNPALSLTGSGQLPPGGASEGSDFAIDGGDTTKVNVLNDCWLVISYQAYITPDTATITFWEMFVRPNSILDPAAEASTAVEAGQFWRTVRTPPMFLSAGAQIQPEVGCNTSAGTWTLDAGSTTLWIVRVG